jgi:hypothetical protein
MTALTSRGYVYQVAGDPADGPAATQALAASVDTDVAACLPDLAVTTLGDFPGLMTLEYPVGLAVANDAIVSVIRPRETITPTKFVWWCTVQSGNYDVAIVDVTSRARLWSSGSLACPAAGEIVVPIAAGPTLTAGGRCALVFAADNTTIRLWGNAFGTAPAGLSTLYDGTFGTGVSTAAFPVPATIPAWASANTIPALALRA